MTLSATRIEVPSADDREDETDGDQSDFELVATLVRQGDTPREARARAGHVLDLAGGAWGLPHLGRSQFQSAGLTDDSIARVRAALALGARVAAARAPMAPMDADAVNALFRPLLLHLPHEEMHVVLLDARLRYRSRRRVASGGVAACSVFVKDILGPVVELRAPALVIVHNHPSGASRPSTDDIALTTRVISACDALSIRLIDHLVVAEDGHASAMPGKPGWNLVRVPRSVP